MQCPNPTEPEYFDTKISNRMSANILHSGDKAEDCRKSYVATPKWRATSLGVYRF